MQTLFPTKPSPATVVLLAASVLLALVGIGGVASGAADSDSAEDGRIARRATTTTEASTRTTLDGSSATTAGPVTTVKSTVTAKKPATTTTASGGAPSTCSSTPASVDPGAQQPPAIGTYTYVVCTDPSKTNDLTVAAGQNSGGITRREISASQSEFGSSTATTAYSSAGIVQEKLIIRSQGVTLECDWRPDIVEYPPTLSVGATWSADSSCTASTGFGSINIRAVATRKITGRVQTKIGGASVNTWVVDSHLNLTFNGGPPAAPVNGSVEETSISYFDPTRGVEVYDKSTSEGKGDFQYDKMTSERQLKSLTPA